MDNIWKKLYDLLWSDDRVYTDQPISKSKGSSPQADDGMSFWDYVEVQKERSLKKDIPSEKDLPPRIRDLVKRTKKDSWGTMKNKSFYEQALFMADYEDDYPEQNFTRYYPTYADMNPRQMRSYFSLRTKWRKGEYPDCSESYIFVYIYEILMQVGVKTPDEGLDILIGLDRRYGDNYHTVRYYLYQWERDYAVWYGLTGRFDEVFREEKEMAAQADAIINYQTTDDIRLFEELNSYSRYNMKKTALYKKCPEECKSAVPFVIRGIFPFLEKVKHRHMPTLLLGYRRRRNQIMFNAAVFYSPKPVKEANVEISVFESWQCKNGIWEITQYAGNVGTSLSPQIMGNILHEIDRLLREQLLVKPALTARHRLSQETSRAIAESVRLWKESWEAQEKERKEAARRKAVEDARASVSIDFSELDRIRRDADAVREALTVEEAEVPEGENIPVAPSEEKMTDSPAIDRVDRNEVQTEGNEPSSGAEGQEKIFLRILLDGGDYKGYLRSIHLPEGVMVERINTLMMPVIGDIAIEETDGKLCIIDDYRTDIEEYINERGAE